MLCKALIRLVPINDCVRSPLMLKYVDWNSVFSITAFTIASLNKSPSMFNVLVLIVLIPPSSSTSLFCASFTILFSPTLESSFLISLTDFLNAASWSGFKSATSLSLNSIPIALRKSIYGFKVLPSNCNALRLSLA